MHLITERTMDAAYERLVRGVERHGESVSPRGHKCVECRPASFTIDDAGSGLYRGASRRLNYRFFAVEALSYIAGWGEARHHANLLCASNKKMAAFLNPVTGTFDGAYGPRLAKSLPAVVELLRRDPDSRQAYASIWSPGIPEGSLDVPCTLGLHFYKETADPTYPALGMTAMMRSNDLNWGTPYDVGAFCAIQCLVAGCLGWHVGKYHHHAGSLHYYQATPPEVNAADREAWVMTMRVPQFPEQRERPFAAQADAANNILHRLAIHVLEEKARWEDFNHPAAWSGDDSPYWREWVGMLRYQWPARRLVGSDRAGVS